MVKTQQKLLFVDARLNGVKSDETAVQWKCPMTAFGCMLKLLVVNASPRGMFSCVHGDAARRDEA